MEGGTNLIALSSFPLSSSPLAVVFSNRCWSRPLLWLSSIERERGMVGTVRAPAVLPFTFPSPKSSLAQHQLLLFRWQLQVPQNNIFSRYRSRKEQYDLTVRANGYTRIPLETAGAYRLIDEQTGENFIVWGGDDDGEAQVDNSNISNLSFPLPPPPPPSKLKRQQQPTSPPFGKSILSSKSSSNLGAFGKLKAQRVRALLTKTTNNGNRSSSSNRSSSRAEKSKTNTDNNDDIVVNDTHVRSRLKDALVDTQDSNFLRTIAKHSPPPPPPPPPPNSVRTPTQYRPPSRGWGAPPSDTTSDTLDHPKQKRQYRKSNQDSGFFSRKSFNELGCTDDMIKALSSLQFIRPSNIQAMSYATVLQGKSCIIADQSGSGKTLAYLCPIIQGLRQQELMGLGKSASKSPRVVILVPTAELASQVLNNCRSLSRYGVPFRSMVATGGFRQKTQLENLQQELDVLIVTPGRFIYLLNEGFLELSSLRSVVLDEVDILFGDEEFEEVLKSLINSAPMATQYLFATATLPVEIYNKLVEVFPDCEVIMGPGMHRTSSGLEEVLVDCSGDGEEKSPDTAFLNKKAALLQLVQESPVPKTIVFCNKIETCRKVENILKRIDKKEHQIRALPFHSALEQESRLSNMKEFLSSKPDELLFLICTDRASRGIDFNVDHVILFDFPRDPSEYVRRVGRTARGAGGKGRAFVFAVGKQVSLARKIIQRNQKGHPLHDVPSAYELERSSSS